MQILREEMNAIAARISSQHFIPRKFGRSQDVGEAIGDDMFSFKDRKGADMCLGMTHEEVFTSIARNGLRSYKQLPQCWYQIK
jgi:prolyl-tRNA synthetase